MNISNRIQYLIVFMSIGLFFPGKVVSVEKLSFTLSKKGILSPLSLSVDPFFSGLKENKQFSLKVAHSDPTIEFIHQFLFTVSVQNDSPKNISVQDQYLRLPISINIPTVLFQPN